MKRPSPIRAVALWRPRIRVRAAALLCAAALGFAGAGYAQISGERGIAPINSSSDLSVEGIRVDTRGENAMDARFAGWKEAQRKGYEKLYAQLNDGAEAPDIPDSRLDEIVNAIVVEREQIGPRRYVATLGILFDRGRSGPLFGVSRQVSRSAPLLVIPVLWIGNTPQVFEHRSDWQRAWARFRTSESPIDYVRVSGTGIDTLLLQGGQLTRPSRRWWYAVLSQYGAASVVIPSVKMEYSYPGGPVTGHFTARFGPDNEILGEFRMTARNGEAIPAMMERAVERIDDIYSAALERGDLKVDRTLIAVEPEPEEELTDLIEDEALATGEIDPGTPPPGEAPPAIEPPPADAPIGVYSVSFATPDEASVGAIEALVAGTGGVVSTQTNAANPGGNSVMSVTYRGDLDSLAGALRSRGFAVSQSPTGLGIRRIGQ